MTLFLMWSNRALKPGPGGVLSYATYGKHIRERPCLVAVAVAVAVAVFIVVVSQGFDGGVLCFFF